MKRFIYIILFVFLCGPLVFAQADQDFSVMEDKADQETSSGRYIEAIKLYKNLADNNYNKSRMYSNIGLCYFYINNYDKAKENFRMALLYGDEEDPTMLANLGAAFNQMDDYKKGLQYSLKALSLEVNTQTLINAISSANNLKDYDKAEEVYNKYALNDFDLLGDYGVRCVIARTYFSQGRYAEAANQYSFFFDGYVEDKKFPVDISVEKRNYLICLIYAAADLAPINENYEEERFTYSDKIKSLFQEKVAENKTDSFFFGLVNLGKNIEIYNPKSTRYFEGILSGYDFQDDFFKTADVLLLSGKYDEALLLLEKNRTANFESEGLSPEQKVLKIELAKYVINLYKYNESVLIDNKTDQKTADEILDLLEKIISKGEVAPEVYKDYANTVEITKGFIRSQLYNHERNEQRDFIVKLITTFNPKFTSEEITYLLNSLTDIGSFKLN